MDEKTKINIFIAHHSKDIKYIPELRALLEKKGYEVRDSSIDENEPNNATNPDYIKSIIRPKIEWAGKIIVLIGKETYSRDWVDWEIEYAKSFGNKKIIGVYLPGFTDADIPENLKIFGDALVPWNSKELEPAIEGKIVNLNPDSSVRGDIWTSERITC